MPHIRQRGVEKELIKLRYYYSAKRWVVIERTNSWWHNRFRKLLVRYEKKSENYLALVCLACCIIVYRRLVDVGRWLIGSEPVVFIEVFPIWFVKDLPGLLGDSDSGGTSSQ